MDSMVMYAVAAVLAVVLVWVLRARHRNHHVPTLVATCNRCGRMLPAVDAACPSCEVKDVAEPVWYG